MLALARSEGQSIIIDGHIEVKIVKWSRSSVRLAIQAPREVTVDRDEIWRKMHPGQATPLEVAEKERNERFAREGSPPPRGHMMHGGDHEVTVQASAAGVFYGSAGPGGSAYVAAGSAVEAETLVGSIKAADGTVTDLHAGVKGTVVRVLASSGQTVAAGEALVAVKVG